MAVACAVHAVRLPDHPSAWFAYASVDDPASFPVPGNPEVQRYGIAAIAACGLGLLLLGAYLTARFGRRPIQ